MAKTAAKAIEHRGITIRERKSASGSVSYRVECPMDWFGKRTFKQFKTKAKCKGFIDDKVNERNQFGELASALTASERTDALNALKVIKGSGATLKECAQFFIAHNRPPAGDITIKELVELYIEKRKKGLGTRRARTLSQRSLEDIINRLTAFSNAYDTKQAKEITSGQIEEWLHREEWSLQTRLNYYRVLHTFFQFAIESGYRTDNPMKKVPKPSPETPEPGILSVAEFERLLNESLDTKNYPLILGYLVFAGFCGIRPEEVEKLTWNNVNLEERFVTIPSGVAKGRQIRNVEIPDCAIEWLLRIPTRKGPLSETYHKRRWPFGRLKAAAGITEWPHDALRHSAGSYHYALHENAEKTIAMLGHTDDKMLFRHYRSLTTKKNAKQFYSITPSSLVPESSKARAPIHHG
jgi:integrase